jgi:hypothetical protein
MGAAPTSGDLAHYYHVYASPPSWRPIVDEHLDALTASGLDHVVGPVRLGIVGSPAERRQVVARVAERTPVTVVAEAAEGWEQLTLARIVDTLEGAATVIYAHTKGVTDPTDEVSAFWRRQMTRVVISEWRQRITDMAGYESAGAFLNEDNEDQPPGVAIYGGNFWWARSTLLRQLPPPRTDDRWGAEGWLGMVPHAMLDLMEWPL